MSNPGTEAAGDTGIEGSRPHSRRARYLRDEHLFAYSSGVFPLPSQQAIFEEVEPSLVRLHYVEVLQQFFSEELLARNGSISDPKGLFIEALREEYDDDITVARTEYAADLDMFEYGARQTARQIMRDQLERRGAIASAIRSAYRSPAAKEELAQALAILCSARQDLPLIISANQWRDPDLKEVLGGLAEIEHFLPPHDDGAGTGSTYTDLKRFDTYSTRIIKIEGGGGLLASGTLASGEGPAREKDWPGFARWSDGWDLGRKGASKGRGPFPERRHAIAAIYGHLSDADMRAAIYRAHPIALMIPHHTPRSYRVADILRMGVEARNTALDGLIDEICDWMETANRGLFDEVLGTRLEDIDWRKYRNLFQLSASVLASAGSDRLEPAIEKLLKRIDEEWTWEDIFTLAMLVIGLALLAATLVATMGGASPAVAGAIAAITAVVDGAGFILQFRDMLNAFLDYAQHGGELYFGQIEPALQMMEVQDNRGSAVFWTALETVSLFPWTKAARGVAALFDNGAGASDVAAGINRARKQTVSAAAEAPARKPVQAAPDVAEPPPRATASAGDTADPVLAMERATNDVGVGKRRPTSSATPEHSMPRPAPARTPSTAAMPRATASHPSPAASSSAPLLNKRRGIGGRDKAIREFEERTAKAPDFADPPTPIMRTNGVEDLPAFARRAEGVAPPGKIADEVAETAAEPGAADLMREMRTRERILGSSARRKETDRLVEELLEDTKATADQVGHAASRARIVQRLTMHMSDEAREFVGDCYRRYQKLTFDQHTANELASLQRILTHGNLQHRRAAISEMTTLMALNADETVAQVRLLHASRATRAADFEVVMKTGAAAEELRQVEVRTITRSYWHRTRRRIVDTIDNELRQSAIVNAVQGKLSRSSTKNALTKQQIYDRGYIDLHIWGDFDAPPVTRADVAAIQQRMQRKLRVKPAKGIAQRKLKMQRGIKPVRAEVLGEFENVEGVFISWRGPAGTHRMLIPNPKAKYRAMTRP